MDLSQVAVSGAMRNSVATWRLLVKAASMEDIAITVGVVADVVAVAVEASAVVAVAVADQDIRLPRPTCSAMMDHFQFAPTRVL